MSLDLSYSSAPPPPDLADRARERGRQLRRRRRRATATVSGAAALVLVAGGVTALQGGGADDADVAVPVDSLPAYVGTGPSVADLALPGRTVRGPEDPGMTDPRAQVPLDGVRLVTRVTATAERSVFISEDLKLCVLRIDPTPPLRSVTGGCGSPTTLPEAGFAALDLLGNSNRPGEDEDDAYFRIGGLVRGPVTRVVLTTPSGEVEGQLLAAPRPELGQLLYLDTRLPYEVGISRPPVDGVRLTAYEGRRPVFSCAMQDLLQQLCTPPQETLPTR